MCGWGQRSSACACAYAHQHQHSNTHHTHRQPTPTPTPTPTQTHFGSPGAGRRGGPSSSRLAAYAMPVSPPPLLLLAACCLLLAACCLLLAACCCWCSLDCSLAWLGSSHAPPPRAAPASPQSVCRVGNALRCRVFSMYIHFYGCIPSSFLLFIDDHRDHRSPPCLPPDGWTGWWWLSDDRRLAGYHQSSKAPINRRLKAVQARPPC